MERSTALQVQVYSTQQLEPQSDLDRYPLTEGWSFLSFVGLRVADQMPPRTNFTSTLPRRAGDILFLYRSF
jgi:hypothetical protein